MDRWVWDGTSLPVPVERIAEEVYGLRVVDSGDLSWHAGGAPHVSGVLLVERSVILVDRLEAARSPGRRRFTIAHELGHLVLHRDRPARRRTSRRSAVPHAQGLPKALRYPLDELEANQFAAALLMPAERIDLRRDQPEDLVKRFWVSVPAAEVRLTYLNWTARRAGC